MDASMTTQTTIPTITPRGQALHLITGGITTLERPRGDALPEHVAYRDDGCDLFPSCLQCPLVRCRYDEPGGARALLNSARDREIRRLRQEGGLTVEEIADRFRVSRRTVFRALATARPQPAAARAGAAVSTARDEVA